MKFFIGFCALLAIAACGTEPAADNDAIVVKPPEPARLAFADVKPILDTRCVACHGAEEPKDGVNLTSYASIMKGGEKGAIVVAGKPDESELVEVISAGHEPRMPFKQDPLTDEEIAKISDWVAQGANE